jgi:hypothetical protein
LLLHDVLSLPHAEKQWNPVAIDQNHETKQTFPVFEWIISGYFVTMTEI